MNRNFFLAWGLLFAAPNALFLCWSSSGREAVPAVAKRLVFVEEHVALGEFLKGESVEFSLQLSNLGADALTIDSVRGDCTCTDVKASSDTILAHTTVLVAGKIKPRAEVGEYQQQIQVRTSGDFPEVAVCRMTYRVGSRFTLQPATIECRTSLFVDMPQTTQFRLINNSGDEVTFQNPHSDIEGVEVQLVGNRTSSGSSCILDVSVDGSNPVHRSGFISLWTGHVNEPLLRLPMRVQPTESVVVAPPSVDWGLVSPSGDITRRKTARLYGKLLAPDQVNS